MVYLPSSLVIKRYTVYREGCPRKTVVYGCSIVFCADRKLLVVIPHSNIYNISIAWISGEGMSLQATRLPLSWEG
jgi:hypothetical protein